MTSVELLRILCLGDLLVEMAVCSNIDWQRKLQFDFSNTFSYVNPVFVAKHFVFR